MAPLPTECSCRLRTRRSGRSEIDVANWRSVALDVSLGSGRKRHEKPAQGRDFRQALVFLEAQDDGLGLAVAGNEGGGGLPGPRERGQDGGFLRAGAGLS